VYGVGAPSLSKSLKIDQKTAKEYLDKYHGLYPGFRKLIKLCEQKAEQEGEIVVWTGRKRHYNMVGMDSHKAMSNLIQGGVAEIARVAISRLYPAISDLGGHMLLQVHDSVMFEIPDDKLGVALPTIKMIMEDFDFVPAVGVDIEFGKSWGTLEKWESS
jgi:DNA polymerase I